jgi:hypothetical protein
LNSPGGERERGRETSRPLFVRGTVFGHKKRYFYMDGPSSHEPKWHAKPEWRAQHGSIPPSGETPEPWKQVGGPYPPWYG